MLAYHMVGKHDVMPRFSMPGFYFIIAVIGCGSNARFDIWHSSWLKGRNGCKKVVECQANLLWSSATCMGH